VLILRRSVTEPIEDLLEHFVGAGRVTVGDRSAYPFADAANLLADRIDRGDPVVLVNKDETERETSDDVFVCPHLCPELR